MIELGRPPVRCVVWASVLIVAGDSARLGRTGLIEAMMKASVLFVPYS